MIVGVVGIVSVFFHFFFGDCLQSGAEYAYKVVHLVIDRIGSVKDPPSALLVRVWKLKHRRLVADLGEGQDIILLLGRGVVSRLLVRLRKEDSALVAVESTVVRRAEDCDALWLQVVVEHVPLVPILLHFVRPDQGLQVRPSQ